MASIIIWDSKRIIACQPLDPTNPVTAKNLINAHNLDEKTTKSRLLPESLTTLQARKAYYIENNELKMNNVLKPLINEYDGKTVVSFMTTEPSLTVTIDGTKYTETTVNGAVSFEFESEMDTTFELYAEHERYTIKPITVTVKVTE